MKLKAYLDMEMDAERKENADKLEREKKRADRAERQLVASIRVIMSSRGKSADDAMDELGIDADMRDYYKAMF